MIPPTIILPVLDPFDERLNCFVVWETVATRQGISPARLAREPQPRRLLGARKTRKGAQELVNQHGRIR